MSLPGRYALTGPAPSGLPAALSATWPRAAVPAGVYNRGQLVLLDETFDPSSLGPWPQVRPAHLAIAHTALGDLFLLDRDSGRVEFLEVQRAKLVQAAADGEAFARLLANDRVFRDLLQRDRVERLVTRLGQLPYASCFILEPWLMLGGVDEDARYVTGKVEVYLNLVGQTWCQVG